MESLSGVGLLNNDWTFTLICTHVDDATLLEVHLHLHTNFMLRYYIDVFLILFAFAVCHTRYFTCTYVANHVNLLCVTVPELAIRDRCG